MFALVARTIPRPAASNQLAKTSIAAYSTMRSSTTHRAAFVPQAKAPFAVQDVDTPDPGPKQILVRNAAIAINPIDFKLQKLAVYPLAYPTILGQDVAGIATSVGSAVSTIKAGDRIIGCAAGFFTKSDADKAFQEQTLLEWNLSCRIPDHVAFDRAAVLSLAITTASAGLFNPDLLGLRLPTQPPRPSTGEMVLVWGGAGSVGSAAIQLAVAAGFEIVSTSSPKNFDLVRQLGASQVFDYNSPSVVEDIVAALQGKRLAGAFDAVGGSGSAATASVVARAEGAKNASTVNRFHPEPPAGVTMKFAASLSIMSNGIGEAIWIDFLPQALEAGTIKPAPEPLVVGHGLESLQTAVDRMGKGVSASKIVITL